MSDLDIHLRDTLWSLGSFVYFYVSNIFGGVSEVVSAFFLLFPCEMAWVLSCILGGLRSCLWLWYYYGSLLCSRFRVFDLLAARLVALLAGSWYQSSPWFLGFSEVLGRTASRLWETSWEVCFLTFVVLFPIRRSFCQDFSLLFYGILNVAVLSPCYVRRRGKIAVMEEFVSGVLPVFYYQLTLSHSDFAKLCTRLVVLL